MNPKIERRVVTQINEYFEPRSIFDLIKTAALRDRSMMTLCFVSAGRISEVVGGPVYFWDKKTHHAVKTEKRHPGLKRENLKVSDKVILITGMKVVKRSHKLIEKYGSQIAIRDDFAVPLELGLFQSVFWDQLVPFGWIIKEYLDTEAPKKGKLFEYEDTRAWQIIRETTKMFPNWFRSQAEHFYGHYLLPDTVKLAKFVKIQDPKHVKHYIGYAWTEQLKDTQISMDFNWIDKTVQEIKNRLDVYKTI